MLRSVDIGLGGGGGGTRAGGNFKAEDDEIVFSSLTWPEKGYGLVFGDGGNRGEGVGIAQQEMETRRRKSGESQRVMSCLVASAQTRTDEGLHQDGGSKDRGAWIGETS